MYAIKLKSDTENQRCIKDHIGHNSKTWPAIPYREKETQIPEECNIFCCEEQSPDFVCHAIAYSTAKGICRMYDLEMDRYDEYTEQYGLVNKDEGYIYFFRRWESQLHDVFNVTIAEEVRHNETVVVFEWLPVFKADWYWLKIDSSVNMMKYGFDQMVVENIRQPYLEIDTRSLPYNQIYNMTILAENMKTQSEPLIIEFLTSPPPIDNLTIVASHHEAKIDWVTEEGAEWFEIKLFNREDTLIESTDEPLYYHEKYTKNEIEFALQPVQGYVLQIRSLAYDYYGNVTEGEWMIMPFYAEFPPLTHLTKDEDLSDCDHVTYSWSNVGFDASYRIQILDLDELKSAGLHVTNTTQFTVPDLLNAHKYSIQVWAVSEKTRGDDLSADFITLLCRPENVHSPHQEDSALEIEWGDVPKSVKYHIQVKPSPQDGLVSRELGVSHAYIEALVPGIQYTISVTAHMTRELDGVAVKSRTTNLFQYTKLLAAKQLCTNNQLLHNSSATFTWAPMGGAEYYYMIIRECTAPARHIMRPGFAMVRGQRCPRWKADKLKCEKIGVSWDQSSKYLMGNVSDDTIALAPEVFILSEENEREFSNLKPGNIYKIWLGGVNKQTYSENAITHFVTRLKTTDAVEHHSLTHDSVHLSWKAIDQANKYTIIVLTDDKKKKRVQKISVTSLETTVNKLHPNFAYIFEIMGENQISFSWPNPVHLRTLLAPTTILSPYSVPRGEEVSADGFIIKWSQVEGAEYYIVMITGPGDYTQEQKVRPLTLEGHTFTPTGLTHNAKHDITIEAFNKFTAGSLMTQSFYTRPRTPDRFRGIAVFDDEVTVAWDLVEDINKYDIYVYDDDHQIQHVLIEDGYQHTFKQLEPNHHYIFVLRAYGHIVSDAARLELYTKIEGVDYLAMNEVYDDHMVLDWKDAAGALQYRVEFAYTDTSGEQSEKRIQYTPYSNIELLDLVPNSIYNIEVFGENANTVGMPMQLTVITKLGYIKKLRQDVSTSTDTTMMIKWLQVPNADFFNIKVTNDKNNKRIQTHKIAATEESILLTDLRPQTRYEVEIQAFSSISDSYPTAFKAQTSMSHRNVEPRAGIIVIPTSTTSTITTTSRITSATTSTTTTSLTTTTTTTTPSTFTTSMIFTTSTSTTIATTTTVTSTATTQSASVNSTTVPLNDTENPPVRRSIKVITTMSPITTPKPFEDMPLNELIINVVPDKTTQSNINLIFEQTETNENEKRKILALVGHVNRFVEKLTTSGSVSFADLANNINHVKQYARDARFNYNEYQTFMSVFDVIKEPPQQKAMLRSAFIEGNIVMIHNVPLGDVLPKLPIAAENIIKMIIPPQHQSVFTYLIGSSWETLAHPHLRDVILELSDTFWSPFKKKQVEKIMTLIGLDKRKIKYFCSLVELLVNQRPMEIIPFQPEHKHIESFEDIHDVSFDGTAAVALAQKLLPSDRIFYLIDELVNLNTTSENEPLKRFVINNIHMFVTEDYFEQFSTLLNLLNLSQMRRDYITWFIDHAIDVIPKHKMDRIIAASSSGKVEALLSDLFPPEVKAKFIFYLATANGELSNEKLAQLIYDQAENLDQEKIRKLFASLPYLLPNRKDTSFVIRLFEAVLMMNQTTHGPEGSWPLDLPLFRKIINRSNEMFTNYEFKYFIKQTHQTYTAQQTALHYPLDVFDDQFEAEMTKVLDSLLNEDKQFLKNELFLAVRYPLPSNPIAQLAALFRKKRRFDHYPPEQTTFATVVSELIASNQEPNLPLHVEPISSSQFNVQLYTRLPTHQRENDTYGNSIVFRNYANLGFHRRFHVRRDAPFDLECLFG